MEPLTAVKAAWFAWRNRRSLKAIVALVAGLLFGAVVLFIAVIVTLIMALTEEQNRCGGPGGGPPGSGGGGTRLVPQDPSDEALSDIPGNYLEAYRKAGSDYGLDWAVLAAIGKIESDHGRAAGGSCAEGPATAYGTAKGPMQFIDSTWETVGVDGNGDGEKNVCDFEDAIPSAANYLKISGAPDDYYTAIYTYNNADWYVQQVLDQAEAYRAADGGGGGEPAMEQLRGALEAPKEAALATVSTLATPFAMREARAEVLGWDLVGGDRNLTYTNHTPYDTSLSGAVSAWDALGSVNVEPAPGGSGADVEVGETFFGDGTIGLTSTDGTMTLDSDFMSRATENARQALFAHEFGHALGLDHTAEPSVMWNIYPDAHDNYDAPTEYDKEVYYSIWGHEPARQGSASGGSAPDATPLSNKGDKVRGPCPPGTGRGPGGSSFLPGRKDVSPGSGSAGDLIQNPNFIGSQNAIDDLNAGIVDERVIAMLQAIAAEHQIYVPWFKTGHTLDGSTPDGPTIPPEYSGTAAGAPNTHYFGRAADIFIIDGCGGYPGEWVTSCGSDPNWLDVGRILAGLPPQERSDVIIGPSEWTNTLGYPREAGWIWDADQLAYHADHLHLGYWSEEGTNNTQ